MGEIQSWVSGLDNVYRAASFMLTANEIATRSEREASACGCPVVRVTDLNSKWRVDMQAAIRKLDADRQIIARQAAAKFDPRITAKQMKEVLEGV
jgi:hypothetical protein